jgi:nicotinamide mononucleotide transporter
MIDIFENYIQSKSTIDLVLEIIIFIFGIWSVWLNKKINVYTYPVGLIATSLTVYIMYKAGYYADMCINFYYSIMSFYGWYYWENSSEINEKGITRTSKTEKLLGIVLFLFTLLIGYCIYWVFQSNVETQNVIDIVTTAVFFTAMWFMARKKIENWMLWIFGNIAIIPILIDRNLEILAIQYFIFAILAIFGYIEWKRYLVKKI